MPFQFVYWGIYGRVNSIRMILAYTGIEYEERNPSSPEEYMQWAAADNVKIPNLPYIVDGDFTMTESGAIPYYIAKKYGKGELFGKDLEGESRVREMTGIINDLLVAFGTAAMNPEDKAKIVEGFKEGSKGAKLLKKLSTFLGEKDWILDDFTFPDIVLGDIVYFMNATFVSAELENPLTAYPNLIALSKRLYTVDGIGDFLKSDKFKNIPMMPPTMMGWVKHHPLP